MISTRTLRRWRAQALVDSRHPIYEGKFDEGSMKLIASRQKQLNERVLKLTQELMDIDLVISNQDHIKSI